MSINVGLTTRLRDAVGGKTAAALEKQFELCTVHDLLLYLPRRHQKRGELTDLSKVEVGTEITVMARVKSVDTRKLQPKAKDTKPTKPRYMTTVVVTDGRADLSLVFFGRPYIAQQLTSGTLGLFAGQVSRFGRVKQLTHPDFEVVADSPDLGADAVEAFADRWIPIYPSKKGMLSWQISKTIDLVLDQIHWQLEPEPLPESVRSKYDLTDMAAAFEGVHRPKTREEIAAGLHRLRWEEAFALQTVLAMRRHDLRDQAAVSRQPRDGGLLTQLDARLPFELTAGQREVGQLLASELASGHPMHRLLQGEVGSGKTVVALRAMLAVVDGGGQAAILAPTEVLAAQHFRSITALLGPLGQGGTLHGAPDATQVVLLTGSQSKSQRREALLRAASGEAGIVVGTHALLQDAVSFADLGLVVVDEQHRFGVEQRARLTQKAQAGVRPHLLVMTATPIPRTVAITVFGDLEISTLRELPKGRSPISTHAISSTSKPAFLDRTWERIIEEVAHGQQAYVVCPRIGLPDTDSVADFGLTELLGDEEGDDDDSVDNKRELASVLDMVELLRDGPLAGLRVEALHGQMPADSKDEVFARFAEPGPGAGGTDVLVATTVIEVGVDVPNATVMVVMDADRFGLSQLHQLRGRIGRGAKPGLCLLVTPLEADNPRFKRLTEVAATNDGFQIARLDLATRKEGDVLGWEQSGRRSSLRVLSLRRDEEIIVAARQAAEDLVAVDPTLTEHPALAQLARGIVGPERETWLDRS